MKNIIAMVIFISSLSFIGRTVFAADFSFKTAAFYSSDSIEYDGESTTNHTINYVIDFSVFLSEDILVGYRYLSFNSVSSLNVENVQFVENGARSASGAFLAYFFTPEFFTQVSYLFLDPKISSDETSNEIDAPITVDVGYLFKSGNIGFGPQLTYIRYSYQDDLDNSDSINVVRSNIMPMAVFAAEF